MDGWTIEVDEMARDYQKCFFAGGEGNEKITV
jgi:hypothetical protein